MGLILSNLHRHDGSFKTLHQIAVVLLLSVPFHDVTALYN
ncbi:hypothetical protein DSUL_200003 [Desulfovibrionales bacterium]